jgi:hypothetical protein
MEITRLDPRDGGGAPSADWNEVQFLSWTECREMAPSILQLEITRLGTLLAAPAGHGEIRNSLVRARFEIQEFVSRLEQTTREMVEAACLPHLQVAIVSLSVLPDDIDEQTRATCGYVLDRLQYVHHRIRLLY